MALIKCPECKKEISGRAVVSCPQCGCPIEQKEGVDSYNSKDVYDKGNPIQGTSKKRSIHKKTGCLIFLIIFVAIIFIFYKINLRAIVVPKSVVVVSKSALEIFVEKCNEIALLNNETANSLYSLIHEQLGFDEITFDDENVIGNTVYTITGDDFSLDVIVNNDGVVSVNCGDFEMYKDGAVQLNKVDIESRATDASYYAVAKVIVEQSLNSPSIPHFAAMDQCNIQRNGLNVGVQGYVDAQNSSGAMLRSDFFVEFKIEGNVPVEIDGNVPAFNYTTFYTKIGDKISGKFINLD